MAMNHDIRIKVSLMQYETIKNRAEINGYKTISSFIRQRILKDKDETDKILNKIYNLLEKKR